MNDKFLQNNNSKNSRSIVKRSGWLIGTHTHRILIKPAQLRYVRLYHQRSMALISDLMIIIGIMVLFTALIFFWNHPITSNRYIELGINADSQLISGEEVNFQINWQNDNRNTVYDSYIVLIPPRGFNINSVDSGNFEFNSSTNSIAMGDLLSGTNGKIYITGQMWADLQMGVDWEIRLYYNNLGLRHNKTISTNFTYESSLLVGDISVPDRIYVNNPFTINMSVLNSSKSDLSSVVVNLQFPSELEFLQDFSDIKDNAWQIYNLKAGESKQISILGKINNVLFAQAEYGIAANLLDGENTLRQSWNLTFSDFILPKVDLDFSILDQSDYIIGTKYRAQVYYYNYESFKLSDVQIKFYSQANGLVTEFLPKEYYYKEIDVNEENFILPVFSIYKSNGLANGDMSIWVELSWLDYQDEEPVRRYVYSEKRYIKVKPHLNLSAQLYYFTPGGDQICYGPLPPIIGESTSYWVSIRLWPSFGEVENLVLNTDFGNSVDMINYNSSLGSVNKDNNLEWVIDSYNASLSYDPQPRLNIELEVSPTIDQLNTKIILLKNINVTARSLVNNELISAVIEYIDNDMAGDRFRPNNGLVESW